MPPVPDPPREVASFVLRAAELLHAYGTPAHRLERVVVELGQRFGQDVQVFSSPTSLMVAFGRGPDQRVHLARVEPGEVDLGKLLEFDELLDRVGEGRLGPAEALPRMEALAEAPQRWGATWTALGFGLASGTAARFFGGGVAEVVASFVLGLAIGLLGRSFSRRPGEPGLFEPVAAFLAAFGALLASSLVTPLSDPIVALAAVIVLLPGLSLTVALIELATRHLASGTARLAGAAAVFLTIALGTVLGRLAAAAVTGAAQVATVQPAPTWTLAPALLLAPLGFGILFQARLREVPWILVAGVSGFLVARAGLEASEDPVVGAYLGALVVGGVSNLYARRVDRPALVPLLPGILMLVPGSFGYRAIDAFVAHDAVRGTETAFLMVLIAVALVGGLLTANAVVPPRRVL